MDAVVRSSNDMNYNPGHKSWDTSLFCLKMNFVFSFPFPPPGQCWFQTTETRTYLSTLICGEGGSRKINNAISL